MKVFILGCPYKGIGYLRSELDKLVSKDDLIIDADEISGLDNERIFFKDRVIMISDVHSSFIRYPYDLIPPHNETFRLRERTEFLKTLAILLSNSAVNRYLPSIAARNRIFSLAVARSCGFKTPRSLVVIKNGLNPLRIINCKQLIVKSLGNCYYSEKKLGEEKFITNILRYETDGGEKAYIYPAHKLSEEASIDKYIKDVGTFYCQELSEGNEFRIFVVKNKVMYFVRSAQGKINGTDKSGDALKKCSRPVNLKEEKRIIALREKLNLNYLCLDGVLTSRSDLILFDVNPFGAFPKGCVAEELARFIFSKK
ncbi:MAG: hypothetical protein ACM3KM_02690 [Acidobacteriaceae bacterium]